MINPHKWITDIAPIITEKPKTSEKHTHTLDTSLWQTERPGNKDVLLTVIGTLHNENRLQGLLPTDPSNTRDVLIMIIQTSINT